MIDITKPLELSDGTPIVRAHVDYEGDVSVTCVNSLDYYFKPDGEPVWNWVKEAKGRTLRNVKEMPVNRTSEECLQRMETFVRRMATGLVAHTMSADEAKAIVAELDAANGPQTDEEWAKHIWDKQFGNDTDCAPCGDTEAALVSCIAKGRELERNKIGLTVSGNRKLSDPGHYDG